MTPQQKKILSTFAVAAGAATLSALGQYVVKLPPALVTPALSILAAALYALKSWGTQEEIDARVLDQVTKAVSGEPK
jgi:hypothetical protein